MHRHGMAVLALLLAVPGAEAAELLHGIEGQRAEISLRLTKSLTLSPVAPEQDTEIETVELPHGAEDQRAGISLRPTESLSQSAVAPVQDTEMAECSHDIKAGAFGRVRNVAQYRLPEPTGVDESTACATLQRNETSLRMTAPLPRAFTASGQDKEAAEFVNGVEYVVQGQTRLLSQSNPFHAEEGSERKRGTSAWVNTFDAAAVVPLASERTRLELAGSYGHAAYDRSPPLDHRPLHFVARLPWQAGDVLAGSFEHVRDIAQYRWPERTWPDGDTVGTTRQRAEVGLRVTESLTLPVIALGQEIVVYGHERNFLLFDRNLQWREVSVRYQAPTRSQITLGWRTTEGNYRQRTDEVAAVLGRRYRDRDLYAATDWRLSDKAIVAGRAGWRLRRYEDVAGRDADLPSAELRAGWDYSVKTRFDARLWRQSYVNDRDESVLYSTYTGGQLFARWQPSHKTFVSLGMVHELQDDTLPGGQRIDRATRSTRLGSRVEWTVTSGVQMVFDAWRDHTAGRAGRSGFVDHVVRIGLVISYGNRFGNPERLLWVPECEPPRYVEASACRP